MSDDKDVLELNRAKNLPIAERVAHTNWKARAAAYDDIAQACRQCMDDHEPCLMEYGPLFAKAVAEPNAAAVDKALDALHEYLKKANEQHASRISERVCSVMTAKCLSSRTSTLTRVMNAMLFFIELEQADKVMDSLMSALSNKNPKVVVAALEMIYNALNLFGHKVVSAPLIMKALPAYFEVKDGKAREKVKEIVVELSRWTGPEVVRQVLFDKMREAMQQDIAKAMEMVERARKPVRLTRKEQAKAAVAQESDPASGDGDGAVAAKHAAAVEDDMPSEIDSYDCVEPKKVLNELKSDNFWDKLEEKKWTERRDALLLLKTLVDVVRIAPGDYGDLVRELKKLISKDSNVVVVAEAINCCGLLAKGLRKDFSQPARNMAGLLFEKYKEKNSAVGSAVTGALTHMHKYCWSLQDVVEDATAAMGHANPKVKEDTYKWLTTAISQEPKANLKPLAAPLMGAGAKGAEEAAPALREAALAFMSAFTVRFGNTAVLEKFCSKMDEAKKKKLQDMVAEAMGAGAAATTSAAHTRASVIPASAPPPPGPTISLKSRLGGTSRSSIVAKTPSAASAGGSGAGTGSGAGAGKRAAAGGDDDGNLEAGALSKDQAVEALTVLVGEQTVKELQDGDWKVRLEAMGRVASKAAEPGIAASNGSMLAHAMSHLPGWAEKNFQVMAKQFEVLRIVAEGCPSFSKRDAFVCINGVIDKVADAKLKQASFDALSAASEAVGPQFVMAQLHKKASAHKNPKVQSEAINWISQAIAEFGIICVDVAALLGWAKEDLAAANPGVRNAAVGMMGMMSRFLGPSVVDMVRADVKPGFVTPVESEVAKAAELGKPEPKRIPRAGVPTRGAAAGGKGTGKGPSGNAANAGAAASTAAMDVDDLLPRNDISGLITSELVTQLGSANWKERKAGLDAIDGILASAGNRIQPQTGDLLPELKKRLADSNKNLVAQALGVLGHVARAMGRAIDRQGRPLLAPAVKNITDQKQTVRSAVVEMLDTWVAATSASCVMSEVAEFFVSSKITTDGKVETLKWLPTLVLDKKLGDCVSDALKMGGLGGQDKAVEVREAASKLMGSLVEVYGAAELGAAAQSLDAASRKIALEAIAKATGAPVPVVAAAAASTSGRPATASSSVRNSTTSLRASTTSIPKSVLASVSSTRPTTAKPAGILNKSMTAGSLAAVLATDGGALIVHDNKKDDRAKKGKYRPAKLQIMPDEGQSLEADFSPLLGPSLKAAVFSKDFKKHCEAADIFTRAIPEMYAEVISVVDLLFRWSTLRILEANTASLVKVLEMLKVLLDAMIERQYKITEYEAKLILPALVEKSGHNQDKLKAEHRELLKRMAQLYPPAKILSFIKDGLESKNSKTRVVCMDEIAAVMDRYGPDVYRKEAAAAGQSSRPASGVQQDNVMTAVARLVAERDTAVRGACLGVMETLYCMEGDGIWTQLGRLTDQQKSLIEERIKTAGNKLARAGLVPGYKAAEYGASVQEPVPASPAPRRPASPLRRSGIGMGAAAAPVAPSPQGRPGILDNAVLRAPLASVPSGLSHLPPGEPLQSLDSRRISSPPLNRFGSSSSLAPLTIPDGGASAPVLTTLEGANEEETMTNWVILHDHLNGDDIEASVQAMKLLCYNYSELDKYSNTLRQLLTDARNTNELAITLSRRHEQAYTAAGASTQSLHGASSYHARFCKYTVNAMERVCAAPGVAAKLNDTALVEMFNVLLAALIDGRLRQLPDGDGFLRAINLVIMKLIEQGNRGGVFGALITCLRRPNQRIYDMAPPTAAGREEMLARWHDMVVKCLIKMTKLLGNMTPGKGAADVLVHVHHYMEDIGADELRRRGTSDDKPLRMVKTILHELCKHRGREIMNDVDTMPGVNVDPSVMVMMPYIRLNLDTIAGINKDRQPAAATVTAVGVPANAPASAQPVLAGLRSSMQTAPTSAAAAPSPAVMLANRSRGGIPSAGVTGFAGAPASAGPPVSQPPSAPMAAPPPPQRNPQVLAPLSTNAMPPSAAATASPKPQASAAPAFALPATAATINLLPSSREFTRIATDEQDARNVLAVIFKRIGDKSQSSQALVDLHHFIEANPSFDVLNQMLSQVSPYFKTYLQRGLAKVRMQLQHAANAAAAAAAAGQDAAVPASPAPTQPAAAGSNAGASGSSWGSPEADGAGATGQPVTIADKLAAAEGRPHSPASPGRLRGVGNLDELRNRMNSLSTNLGDLPLRSSTSLVAGMTQGLSGLQERMKRIQSIAPSN